ncbi:MAG TPA: hypothetical protein DCS13_09070, partial [Candidatus Margulisbacteria bacterium]|nr:hypothetical protein [Candidatus Margulisiibacteriota bacterium]
ANNVGSQVLSGAQIYIDTATASIRVFEMRDKDSSSTIYTDYRGVDLELYGDSDVVGWIVTENASLMATAGSVLWGEKPGTYTLTDVQGTHNLYVWTIDRALNISSANTSIIYDNLAPSVSIEMNKNPSAVPTGTVIITVNITDVESGIASTPSVWYKPYGKAQVPITLTARIGNLYLGVFDVTTVISDGPAYYGVTVEDNLGHISTTVKSIIYNNNPYTNSFVISKNMGLVEFNLYDQDTFAMDYTNDQKILVQYSNDTDSVAWILSETQATRPNASNPGWENIRPVYYIFKNNTSEIKTIYLWTKNGLGNISEMAVTRSIAYDNKLPAASISMRPYPSLPTGDVIVTVNIINEDYDILVTPHLTYTITNNVTELKLMKAENFVWFATFNISCLNVDGIAAFSIKITDNAMNVGTSLLGASTFNIDTIHPVAPKLVLSDLNSASTINANSRTVNVQMADNNDIAAWMLSETRTTAPLSQDSGWVYTKPLSYTFPVDIPDIKTVYLWVKDDAGNINEQQITATINYDNVFPTGHVSIAPSNSVSSEAVSGLLTVTLALSEITTTPQIVIRTSDLINYYPAVKGNYPNWTADFHINNSTPGGIAYISYRATDNAGNIGTQISSGFTTFNIDTSINNPSMNIYDFDSGSGVYTNQRIISVNITNDPDIVAWIVEEGWAIKPEKSQFASYSTKPVTINLSAMNDDKTVYVWVMDHVGNINPSSIYKTIKLDNTPPIGLVSMSLCPDVPAGKEVRVTIDLSETLQIAPVLSFTPSGNAPVTLNLTGSNRQWAATFSVTTQTGDGTAKWNVAFLDVAGNLATHNLGVTTFNIQTSIPADPVFNLSDLDSRNTAYSNSTVVSINISSSTANVSVWFFEEVPAGGTAVKPLVDDSRFNTNPITTFAINNAEGQHDVWMWIKNNMGNVNNGPAKTSIILDTVPPSATFSLVDTNVSYGNHSIVLSLSEAVDSVPSLNLNVSPNTYLPVILSGSGLNWTGSFLLTSQNVTNGVVTWNLLITDLAGNPRFIDNKKFTVDTSAPPNPVVNIQGLNQKDPLYKYIKTKDGWVKVSISNLVSGSKYLIDQITTQRMDAQAAPPSSWIDFDDLVSGRTMQVSSGEGINTIYIWVKDNLGNVNFNLTSVTINYDPSKPQTAISTVPNMSDMKAGPVSVFLTTNEPLISTPSLQMIPSGSTGITINIDTVNSDRTQWQGSFVIVPEMNNGVAVFSVCATDNAENVNNSVDAGRSTFNIDTIIPSISAYTLYDSTSYSMDFTNSLQISLAATFDSDVVAWFLKENAGAAPQYNTVGWQSLQPAGIDLSDMGDTTRRISLWVKDRANNISSIIDKYITVDRTAPSGNFTLTDKDSKSEQWCNDLVISVNISTDADVVAWLVKEDQLTPVSENSNELLGSVPGTVSISASDGEKNIYLWIKDRAGNLNSVTFKKTILLDRTLPMINFNPNTIEISKAVAKAGDQLFITFNAVDRTVDSVPRIVTTSLWIVPQSGIPTAAEFVARTIHSTFQFNPIYDGNYYRYSYLVGNSQSGLVTMNITVTDKAGNISTTINNTTLIIDNDCPVVTTFSVTPQRQTNRGLVTFSLGSTDNVMISTASILVREPGYNEIIAPYINKVGDIYYFNYKISGDESGTVNITANITDIAGNTTVLTANNVLYANNDMPMVAEINIYNQNTGVYGYVRSGDYVLITANIVNGSGVSINGIHADLTCLGRGNNISPDIWDQETAQWQVTAASLVDATATLGIFVVDNLGNTSNMEVKSFIIDNTVPTVDASSVFADKYVAHVGSVVTISFNASDINGIVTTSVSVKEPGIATSDAVFVKVSGNSFIYNYPVKSTFDGSAVINVMAKDMVSNTYSTINVVALRIDNTAASISIIEMSKYPYVSSGDLFVTVNVSESLEITPDVYILTSGNTNEVHTTFTRKNGNSWAGQVNIAGNLHNGIASIYTRVTDNAGIVTTVLGSGSIATINIDTIAPPAPSLFIIRDRNVGRTEITDERLVSIDIVSDPDVQYWLLSEDQTSQPTPNNPLWAQRGVCPVTFNITSAGDGTKKLYLWTRDNALNLCPIAVSSSIMLDNTGAMAVISMSPYPDVPSGPVSVNIAVSEKVFVTPQVSVITSLGTVIAINNLIPIDMYNWQGSFRVTGNNISGDGIATFNIVVEDSVGNISSTLSAGVVTFNIDTTHNNSVFALRDQDTEDDEFINDSTVLVDYLSDEDSVAWMISEVVSKKPAVNDYRWANYQPVFYTFKNIISGNKTVYLWTKDKLGNINPGVVSWNVVFDNIPPKGSILYFKDDLTGDVPITLSVLNEDYALRITPNLMYGTSVNMMPVTLSRAGDFVWVGTFNIDLVVTKSYLEFAISITDNASNLNTDKKPIGSGGSSGGDGTGDGDGGGGGGTGVVPEEVQGKVLIVSGVIDTSPKIIYTGDTGPAIITLDARASSNILSWYGVQVVLTGNVLASNIEAVKVYRAGPNINSPLENAVLISSGTDIFVRTTANLLVASITFLSTEKVDVSGNKYVIAAYTKDRAVPNQSFRLLIPNGAYFSVNSGNIVESALFPVQTGFITIKEAPNKLLMQSCKYIIPCARQNNKDVLAGAVRLRSDKNLIVWRALSFKLDGSIKEKDIKNIKIYKDNGDSDAENSRFDVNSDELISSGEYIFVSGNTVYLELRTVQEISSEFLEGRVYFIALDFDRYASVNSTMQLVIPDPSSFIINSPNITVDFNFPYESETNTLNRYNSEIKVKAEELINSAVYPGTDMNLIAKLAISLDSESRTINSLALHISGTSNVYDKMTISIYRDVNRNDLYDVTSDVLVGHTDGYVSETAVTINFITPIAVDVVTRNYLILVSLGNEARIGNSFGCSLGINDFVIDYDSYIASANLPFQTHVWDIIDRRQPEKPKVSGNYFVADPSSLIREVKTFVPDGVISRILQAIGSAPGLDDVMPWSEVDTQVLSAHSVKSKSLKSSSISSTYNISGVNLQHKQKYYYSVKAINEQNSESFESEVSSVPFEVDLTPPKSASDKKIHVYSSVSEGSSNNAVVSHALDWNPYLDEESGIKCHEVWQSTGFEPKWINVAIVTGNKSILQLTDREKNSTYYYKIRAINNADNPSDFDLVSDPTNTSYPGELISKISNYPNPFDSRQKLTTITYFLSKDITVTIKIFDALGHVVSEKEYNAGSNGGQKGTNKITWDGTNDNGKKVGKGGYIMYINPVGIEATGYIALPWIIGVIH